MSKLKEMGYTYVLTIEREAGANRIADILKARTLLERLRDER
jgi:sugar phosphate isomerase/epimerase